MTLSVSVGKGLNCICELSHSSSVDIISGLDMVMFTTDSWGGDSSVPGA